MKAGTADVGFMGPLQYVIAHQQSGAVPILGEVYSGSPTYLSKIFVRKDSGIESPAELRGKTMAFVDPLSSSGYLFPLDTFRQAGLITSAEDAETFFRKIYFAGGDEQAIRAVLNKFVDAAGVGQYSVGCCAPKSASSWSRLPTPGRFPRTASSCGRASTPAWSRLCETRCSRSTRASTTVS